MHTVGKIRSQLTRLKGTLRHFLLLLQDLMVHLFALPFVAVFWLASRLALRAAVVQVQLAVQPVVLLAVELVRLAVQLDAQPQPYASFARAGSSSSELRLSKPVRRPEAT